MTNAYSSPKDHPTFKRALTLAHKALLTDRGTIAERVKEILSQTDFDEAQASDIALSELAHKAYANAVDVLERECSRRVSIRYTVEGSVFLDEACRKMLIKNVGLGPLLVDALSRARDGMPGHVEAILDFGCREDGLIFGRARHRAIGGSFAALQSRVIEALNSAALEEAKARLSCDGNPQDTVEELAPRILDGLLPTLKSVAQQTLPSDETSVDGRPLGALIDDLRDRLSLLSTVEFRADAEPWHTLTGTEASTRLLGISQEANSERPHAAGIARFLTDLGV